MSTTEPAVQSAIRPLRPDEKSVLKGLFPLLNLETTMVRGEASDVYNCLAWTLGITTRWVWPWPKDRDATKAEFDALYRKQGLSPGKTGSVAGFGHSISAMTHGARGDRGLVTMPRWSSKLGPYLLIQHELGQLERGGYGNVQGFYSRVQASMSPEERDPGELEPVPAPQQSPVLEALSSQELDFLSSRAEEVDEDLRTRFDQAYAAWRESWKDPSVAISSNPADRARSQQFLQLVALGPGIVPLLMQKLTELEGFFCLLALERLGRKELFESVDLDDEAILAGEQGRARQVIERWIALES